MRLPPEQSIALVKNLYSENDISNFSLSWDIEANDYGDAWHVAILTANNSDGVKFRTKLKFSSHEGTHYVPGIGRMGTLIGMETAAMIHSDNRAPIDLKCGLVRAKAYLLNTGCIMMRTVGKSWRSNADSNIKDFIADIVREVDNEQKISAFANVLQSLIVADDGNDNAEIDVDSIVEAQA